MGHNIGGGDGISGSTASIGSVTVGSPPGPSGSDITSLINEKNEYKSKYLGSKTTYTTGECSCLNSFASAPPSCEEREASIKFKMTKYVSTGNGTSNPSLSELAL